LNARRVRGGDLLGLPGDGVVVLRGLGDLATADGQTPDGHGQRPGTDRHR
jgi:hypothetical protein